MADKTIGELPNLPAISPLDLLVAQHNEEATKITGTTLTNFFKDYIGPVAATSASQMTNTNKVYIYIGNESGYTNGNWYYYNGSTWVSGGAYNSQAVNTDATLTHEGVPADAEAAGKIVEISETQPAAPANRVWIPETQEATVQVPTWAEHEELANDISDLNGAINSALGDFAAIETSMTATRNYNRLDYVVINGKLYQTATAISSGQSFVVNTNIVAKTVGEQLNLYQWNKLYRFGIPQGTAVAAGGTPTIVKSWTYDDSIYVNNGKIHIVGSGFTFIYVHVIGSTGSSGGRLWFKLKGTNTEPQHISYGSYCTGDMMLINQHSTTDNNEIWLEFVEPFTIGGGSTGYTSIYVIRLD